MVLDLTDMDFFHTLVVELVEIFWVDMSSSTKIGNRKKGIFVLGKGLA